MISENCLIGSSDGLVNPIGNEERELFRITTSHGYYVDVTNKQAILTISRGNILACELRRADKLVLQASCFGEDVIEDNLAIVVGAFVGDGWISKNKAVIALGKQNGPVAITLANAMERASFRNYPRHITIRNERTALTIRTGEKKIIEFLRTWAVLDKGSSEKKFTNAIWRLSRKCMKGLLQGIFSTDGSVGNYKGNAYITLDSTSLTLLHQVQLMLLQFCIKSNIHKDRGKNTTRIFPNGKGGYTSYPVKPWHSLRLTRDSRLRYEDSIGFVRGSYKIAQLEHANKNVKPCIEFMHDYFKDMKPIGKGICCNVPKLLSANGIMVPN